MTDRERNVTVRVEERVIHLRELFELLDEPTFAQVAMALELPDEQSSERLTFCELFLSRHSHSVVVGNKDPSFFRSVLEEDGIACPFRKHVDCVEHPALAGSAHRRVAVECDCR
jgi:hypothetical protein